MKKLLLTLASVSLFSALLFGIATGKPAKTPKPQAQKKIAVFGDFGFSRNISHLGKRDLFLQGGAQYRINSKFAAEALFNYHLNSEYPSFFKGRRSSGIGVAGVYRIKLLERLSLDLKAGALVHWNVYMMVYGSNNFNYKAHFGLQGGPGVEYMFTPSLGLRAASTLNLVLPESFWVGFSSGVVFKL
jgi:hypothetical protein